MSTSSDDLAILLNECIRQRDELRALNAELLAALKGLIGLIDVSGTPLAAGLCANMARKAIAKAEGR
jgi:hypothetical protein